MDSTGRGRGKKEGRRVGNKVYDSPSVDSASGRRRTIGERSRKNGPAEDESMVAGPSKEREWAGEKSGEARDPEIPAGNGSVCENQTYEYGEFRGADVDLIGPY